MKIVKKNLMCFTFSLLLTTVVFSAPVLSMTKEEIFNWVAVELKMEEDYPMPEIKVVPREELQGEFKKNIENSYQRWVEEYGEITAQETMDRYLSEVIGLFDPKTKIIYVGDFMESCKFDSIVAHEVTHYFQIMKFGRAQPGSMGFEDTHFFREMQAEHIGRKFIEDLCAPTPEEATVALMR